MMYIQLAHVFFLYQVFINLLTKEKYRFCKYYRRNAKFHYSAIINDDLSVAQKLENKRRTLKTAERGITNNLIEITVFNYLSPNIARNKVKLKYKAIFALLRIIYIIYWRELTERDRKQWKLLR